MTTYISKRYPVTGPKGQPIAAAMEPFTLADVETACGEGYAETDWYRSARQRWCGVLAAPVKAKASPVKASEPEPEVKPDPPRFKRSTGRDFPLSGEGESS